MTAQNFQNSQTTSTNKASGTNQPNYSATSPNIKNPTHNTPAGRNPKKPGEHEHDMEKHGEKILDPRNPKKSNTDKGRK